MIPGIRPALGFDTSGGGGEAVLSVCANTYSVTEVTPTNAVCNLTYNSNGDCSVSSGVTPSAALWHSAGGGAYWIRWTNISGVLTTGSAGTWLSLTSSRTFGKTRTNDAFGTDTCSGRVDIAADSGGVDIVATGTVTFNANIEL